MVPTLTLLGLGPGNPDQRTREAEQTLRAAKRIMLRTGIHPGLSDLLSDPRVSTCDDIYERESSFAAVYDAIVARVLESLADGDLVFAVPGHPLMAERTVSELLNRANVQGVRVRVVPGVSAVDVVAAALGIDPMAQQAQIIDATELERWGAFEPFAGGFPDISPGRPVLLTQIYAHSVATAAKLQIVKVFPEQTEITLVVAAGVAGEDRILTCRLFELDRQPVDHLTTVWIPALPQLEASRWPLTLYHITARLRAPDGCPWDRQQTNASLRASVIEEAYEVAAAIDEGDGDHLAEELGDLLLLVAMHAQIADEAGNFDIGDVYDQVNRKLVRRHPHVFADLLARTPEAVVQTWDAVKAAERANKGREPDSSAIDPYDRMPTSMPVMMRVASLQRRDTRQSLVDPSVLSSTLLELTETLARAGYDPEVELERAYKRRAAGGKTG